MRLINADEFRKTMLAEIERLYRVGHPYSATVVSDVIKKLDLEPSVDAEPVVHAHWIEESKTDKFTTHCCSNCGGILSTYINAPLGTFCYKCGAKMDEEQ